MIGLILGIGCGLIALLVGRNQRIQERASECAEKVIDAIEHQKQMLDIVQKETIVLNQCNTTLYAEIEKLKNRIENCEKK